jgi:hypothetical protein
MTSQEINATIPTPTPAPMRTIFPPETGPGSGAKSAYALVADKNTPESKTAVTDKYFVVLFIIFLVNNFTYCNTKTK